MRLVQGFVIVVVCVLLIVGGRFSGQQPANAEVVDLMEKAYCGKWQCTGGLKYKGYDSVTFVAIGPCSLDGSIIQITTCLVPSDYTCVTKKDAPEDQICTGRYIAPSGEEETCYVFWRKCMGTLIPPE